MNPSEIERRGLQLFHVLRHRKNGWTAIVPHTTHYDGCTVIREIAAVSMFEALEVWRRESEAKTGRRAEGAVPMRDVPVGDGELGETMHGLSGS